MGEKPKTFVFSFILKLTTILVLFPPLIPCPTYWDDVPYFKGQTTEGRMLFLFFPSKIWLSSNGCGESREKMSSQGHLWCQSLRTWVEFHNISRKGTSDRSGAGFGRMWRTEGAAPKRQEIWTTGWRIKPLLAILQEGRIRSEMTQSMEREEMRWPVDAFHWGTSRKKSFFLFVFLLKREILEK